MIKSLADELSDILDRNNDPGLGPTAVEQARMGLITFCRGLVCGLRAGSEVQAGNGPLMPVEGLADKSQLDDWDKAERNLHARTREERARRYDKNTQLRPVDECNIPMMGKTLLEERLKY